MRILLVFFSVLLSSFFLTNLTFADICSDLNLNEAECYILAVVKKGGVADLKERFPNKADRTISSSFLEKLITSSLPGLKNKNELIKIGYADIEGAFQLRYHTVRHVLMLGYCNFIDDISFYNVQFKREVGFRYSRFSRRAEFIDAKFFDGAYFLKTQFLEEADFGGSQFSDEAYFGHAQFFGEVSFGSVKFMYTAGFKNAKFYDGAIFSNTKLLKIVDFSSCKFNAFSNFTRIIFPTRRKIWLLSVDKSAKKMLNSGKIPAILHQDLEFKEIISNGVPQITTTENGDEWLIAIDDDEISICNRNEFKGSPGILKKESEILFDDVTGFSNMQMEWTYDSKRFGKVRDENDLEHRGLKNKFKFNETFYIALVKNYRDMGWFKEADDCYYTYRVEKREHQLKELNNQSEKGKNNPASFNQLFNESKLYGEWLLLDLTFGYGVKPKKIFMTFVVFWAFFIPIYTILLRPQWRRKPLWIRDIHKRFFRAIIFSLDTLTPGVNFRSESTLPPYTFNHSDFRKPIFNFCIRLQQILGWYWAALFLILFSKIWIR
jgi:hypothetical protein